MHMQIRKLSYSNTTLKANVNPFHLVSIWLICKEHKLRNTDISNRTPTINAYREIFRVVKLKLAIGSSFKLRKTAFDRFSIYF